MDILDSLNDAARFAAAQWQATRREGRVEETRRWMQLSEFRSFLGETGQAYRLEKYLGGGPLPIRPPVAASLAARGATAAHHVMCLLLHAFTASTEPRQKQSVFVLISLINFLADTGQLDTVEDYVNHRLEYAPLAVAQFTTEDEVQVWLKGLSEPISPVRVLIGDEYFRVWPAREDEARCVHRDFVIEPYIEALASRGLPSPLPTFASREQAAQWLKVHPAAPFAFVSIQGERHFAVHHKLLGIHSLHPVASALMKWESMKRTSEGVD